MQRKRKLINKSEVVYTFCAYELEDVLTALVNKKDFDFNTYSNIDARIEKYKNREEYSYSFKVKHYWDGEQDFFIVYMNHSFLETEKEMNKRIEETSKIQKRDEERKAEEIKEKEERDRKEYERLRIKFKDG